MTLAPRCGVGLKPEHYRAALDTASDRLWEGLWFEVHPENYMCDGGPRHRWLTAVRDCAAISFHGVGASLGGPDALDRGHLNRLRELIDRYEPAQVSEHVAWSAAGGRYFADLFPLPYTREAARWLASRIDAFQCAIKRRILIENPSAYISLPSEMGEADFLAEICAASGCGVLFDVNNVYVSAHNLGLDAEAMIDAIPDRLVGEVHLAGHEPDALMGETLLIDSHAAPVAAPVWALYERLITRIGPRPTLIERDAGIPPFVELLAERDLAERVLTERAEAA